MRQLPAHHIPRPRLIDRCADERVVVVVAGGGYGKSVLAAELVDAWHLVGIEVALLNAGVSARSIVARLHSAVQRAGFRDAAAAMAGEDDPQGVVEAALDALSDQRCAFVIDDLHHAGPEAATLVGYLAEHLAGDQRCVVLARHVPASASRLLRPDFHQLDAADLALSSDEIGRLCRDGFGLSPEVNQLQAVSDATGGWTAAAVLAAARARRTGEDLSVVARSARSQGAGPVAALIEEAVASLSSGDRELLAQLARLPLLDRASIDAAAGEAAFFERIMSAGIPFTSARSGWADLPGPVRDILVSLGPPDAVVLRRAAAHYVARGELIVALDLLVDSGLNDEAAEILARAPAAAVEGLDPMHLRAIVERLGAAAIEAYPMVLIHVARVCGGAAMYLPRRDALNQVATLAAHRIDPVLDRAIAAEHAKDDVAEARFDDAERRARAVLADAAADEGWTRAAALSALGRATCWRLDDEGRRDLAALREAETHLAAASDLFRRLGMPAAAATLTPYRAMWIEYALGNPLAALDRLDEGLALTVDRPRAWASLMTFRFEIEIELGRFDDCENTAERVSRVAEEFDDAHLRSYMTWNRSIMASWLGDRDATVTLVRDCEREASDWWAWAAADFHASAAESLARVGETALAFEHLQKALADPQDGEPVIAMAEAVLQARAGDPDRAEQLLLAAPTHRVDPREFWRVTLFRALAAFRRGDLDAGALAARAFEEAARLGLGDLPLVKERAVTESLLGLAIQTGQPAALALERVALPVAMRVLGGFTLTRGGQPVPITSGQGTQLLKLLAVHGGRLVTDRVIDALWPDVDADAGRHRLRTVLNRLKNEAGDVVERDGDSLAINADVRIDLALFEAEAGRALALGTRELTLSAALARSAIARYRGDLLPDDPYEPWTERPRDRARSTMLRLLDLCADAATATGDLDELRRVVELTIDLAPYDDERYLRAASILIEQGRHAAALLIIQRARAALAELGLTPSRHLSILEDQIVA